MSRAEMAVVSSAEFNVEHMSKMIQVRNVPEGVHRELKARAAYEGISLSDLIKRELEQVALKWGPADIDRYRENMEPNDITSEEIVADIRRMRGEI